MAELVLTGGAVVSVVQPVAASVSVVALPAGSGAGGGSAYEFAQVAPAATWTISLPVSFPDRRPGVDLYVNDVQVESDVAWYPLTNTIVVTFPSPTSGVAVIT